MTPESSIILSIPELRLCMNVLGCGQWDDLPLMETAEPAEQRLMNAFLHLIQTDRFLPVEGGYQMEPAFEQLMRCIGQADSVCRLYQKGRILAFLYQKDSSVAAVSPDWGSRERCIISIFPGTAPAEVQAWFSEPANPGEEPELRQAGRPDMAGGRYDAEELAFFLGAPAKMEEAK